jgi:16S rRNA (guanine966-N2)-methyltransferase
MSPRSASRPAPRRPPRIVAGELGGRRLVAPAGLTTRPTADRVKEALFSILGAPERRAGERFRVLDLFAGSGALALEALSRGADEAVLVDEEREAAKACEENVRALGLEARARVLHREAGGALRGGLGGFDWIFLDPPYEGGALDRALRLVAQSGALAPGGVVIAEHAAGDGRGPAGSYGALTLVETRSWGDTAISFYREERA